MIPTRRIGQALFAFFLLAAALPARAAVPELVIYTYDSFAAPGGLGSELIPLFEKKCGCRVRALSSGDGGQILTRLQLDEERGKSIAHVVVGIDRQLWGRAKRFAASWGDWTPKGWTALRREVKGEPGFLPYDFGPMAFMADQEQLKALALSEPKDLRDLLKPEFKRRFILEDPRTSTPGLGFLLYTVRALPPAEVWSFWRALKKQWLALVPGWDQAYGLFLKKEAPLAWSYVTSQAYHRAHGDKAGRFESVRLTQGHPIQVEGAFITRTASPERAKLARDFLQFLISIEAQKRIPERNWMMPAASGVSFPKSFEDLPKLERPVSLPTDSAEIDAILKKWVEIVEGE